MKDNPLVSVIIPVYNTEKYLRQCLDSVIAQTYNHFEVICVDDGSTDTSPQILQEYSKKYTHVKVITQPNQNAGTARNTGMEVAKGKYLYFFDSDDYIDPNLLALATERAETDDSDIVCFHYIMFFDKVEFEFLADKENFISHSPFSYMTNPKYIFQYGLNSTVWTKFYKKSFINKHKILFQPEKRGNDIYFTFIASVKAHRISFIEKALVTYRTGHSTSLQATNHKEPMNLSGIYRGVYYELKEMGIFSCVEQSFINSILMHIIHSLDTILDYDILVNQYSDLSKNLLAYFDIFNKKEDFFYSSEGYILLQMLNKGIGQYLNTRKSSLKKQNIEIRRTNAMLTKVNNNKIWPFPFHLVEREAKIILYGAGAVGKDFYHQVAITQYCHIILWVDQNYETMQNPSIHSPKKLVNFDFDKVLIAVFKPEAADSILNELILAGIPKNKIIIYK